MRPVLFRWRNFTVWSYPAMLYVGLVTGIVAGNAAAHSTGLDAFRVFVATLVLTVPAIVGSRLFYAFTHRELYQGDFRRIWDRRNGGAAMYGGMLGAMLLSIPVLAMLQIPFGEFWDVATFTILVGMIFARVGCLMNGCCAGRPSRSILSLNLPNRSGVWTQRFPTQTLEAAWAAALLLLAVVARKSMPFPGALFLFVASGYACGRLWLESTRERPPDAHRITIHHAISALIIIFAVAALAARWPN
jgi:phosphatidylglycerol---prolipoprotein diacylglyceryl transferase